MQAIQQDNNTLRVFSKQTKLHGIVMKFENIHEDDDTVVKPTYKVKFVELSFWNDISCNWEDITSSDFSNFIVTRSICKHLNAGSYWLRLGEYSVDRAIQLFNEADVPTGPPLFYEGCQPFTNSTETKKVFDKKSKLYGEMRMREEKILKTTKSTPMRVGMMRDMMVLRTDTTSAMMNCQITIFGRERSWLRKIGLNILS